MALQYGPQSFDKVVFGSKVNNIEKHKNEQILLLSTQNQTLQCHYLKSARNKQPTRLLKMKEMSLQMTPKLFAISNKFIVHCEDNLLKINNRYELKHQSTINHLLVDQYNIALTTSTNNIKINSISENKLQAQLSHSGENISSIFWNNSLIISGNQTGLLNVWDINKQNIVDSKCVSEDSIDLIDVFVDLVHTNVYYCLCKKERRLSFFDLRAYKKINSTQNLPKNIVDIKHNKSGKIFIMSFNQLYHLDLYQGYHLLGKFKSSKPQIQNKFINSNPINQMQRSLNDMLIWDQYILLGCSNGCIEVYNSDTNKSMYSFGLGQYSGIKKLMQMNDNLISFKSNGTLEIAKMI